VQERADGGTVLTFNNLANLQTTPLAPIQLNERGESLGAGTRFWTGTAGGGAIDATCASWVSSSWTTSTAGTVGATGTTGTNWTNDSYLTCYSETARLLCLEESKLPAPQAPAQQQRRLFVTSTTYQPGFGAVSSADGLCNTSAQAANKTGTWKAWLSSATMAAHTRMANVGPWVQERSDGGTVLTFNNLANLQTTPLVGIQLNERGESVGAGTRYWTGTGGGGAIDATCANWTSSSWTTSTAGTVGATGTTGTGWTNDSYMTCYSESARLLCFEQ
jgi:hypothetical protein